MDTAAPIVRRVEISRSCSGEVQSSGVALGIRQRRGHPQTILNECGDIGGEYFQLMPVRELDVVGGIHSGHCPFDDLFDHQSLEETVLGVPQCAAEKIDSIRMPPGVRNELLDVLCCPCLALFIG